MTTPEPQSSRTRALVTPGGWPMDQAEGGRGQPANLGIIQVPQNSAGLFFVTVKDEVVLTRWIRLGWTKEEAEERIQRMADGYRLAPSQTGYVLHL
jgi:hypothetical protein